MKLKCYLRERARIIALANVLEKRDALVNPNQSEQYLERLKSECWDLIKSEVHPSPGLLVADGNDML